MAASQLGTSPTAQIADNRIFLFRLQMLIIDGGLAVLRHYVDQELSAQSITLSGCLANERTTCKLLKGRGIITQVQYDLLYPSSGTVLTSDLDITLIICLMRNLKCFKLNSKFNWNIPPIQNDTSIEADIFRLKKHRNAICHISTTTGMQHNDFITQWKEIEQILLRINKVYPIKDFQQTITDFQFSPLDPNTEKRVTDEIDKWEKFDKSVEPDLELLKTDQKVMKLKIKAHNIELAETRKQYEEGLEAVHNKIAEIEKQLPAPDNYQKRKLELQHGLITFYKTRHSQVFLSPLFEEKDTPLASFYIRPELRYCNKKSVKSLSEIFRTKNIENREIYVLADAGLGKTAFSKYLAIMWCQAHCPNEDLNEYLLKDDIYCMQKFDFLFLVSLRDSDDLCSIDDLIFEKIISDLGLEEKLSEEFLLRILKKQKCLIILDGLDEWTHPDNKCNRSPRSIPHRNDRENCIILTTTRPWKLGVLDLNSCQLGKKIELTELSNDSAVTLRIRMLQKLRPHQNKDSLERNSKLIKIISSRGNAELTSVPLLLIYTICLWCDGVQIGNSKCDLYINIVELLLLRTIQKHGKFQIPQEHPASDIPECFAEYENCKTYFKLLIQLGKLAYYTLLNETRENTLVFDGSVTKKYLTLCEMKFTLLSGMLSESTTNTLTKKFSKVSFSHKTVQEFFAAIFISSHSDAQKIVLEKCRNIEDILDMSKICEYASEINADRMCAISNDLMSVINEDEKTRDYRTRTGDEDKYNTPLYNIQKMLLSCLQEMPESENLQFCLQDFFIDEDTEHSKQLQKLLKQNKTNVKSLYINTSITSSSLREIIDLFSLTDLSHIQKLYYRGDILKKKEAEIDQILFPSLEYLTLSGGKRTVDEEKLSENLARLHNLQCLCIRYFSFSHKILDTFFNFISRQKSMKELSLAWLYCKEHWRSHDCMRFNLNLSQHTTLENLYLWAFPCGYYKKYQHRH
ncbi:uncharacterized protein LOC132727812 [Ruditapes philippinarum]|uniref:uncharacterized protein LOC132727812 n=1 Tax=Ruditapes philippinarum TaxID=129788 RepID=UPI00295B0B1F|nr:uncharacterized protein LOC132727812 [Ruditapes philippinarum]